MTVYGKESKAISGMKCSPQRLEYMRQWRNRNKDRQKEWFRQHYLNHKEEKLKQCAEYAKNNPERITSIKRRYVERNRELLRKKGRLQAKAYRTKYPDKVRATHIASKHKRRALESVSKIDLALIKRWIIEVRTKPFVRCHWCGTKVSGSDIHFDHIVPLARGGTHTIGNLCASCAECNQTKHARLLSDWVVNGQMFLL